MADEESVASRSSDELQESVASASSNFCFAAGETALSAASMANSSSTNVGAGIHQHQGGVPSSESTALASSRPGSGCAVTDKIRRASSRRKIWKVVLTGGPCAGKTTGQARLSTFFESIGWKVYRVPEAANILLSGGVSFLELSEKQQEMFQENLFKVIMQVEKTYFDLAAQSERDTLIICDRGCMDASAFIDRAIWHRILDRNHLNEVDIRDNRYNQVIHLVSAAQGAEDFYTIDNHTCRHESIDLARKLDVLAAEAWIGHPNVTCVGNSSDFETKINSLISKVVHSIGLNVGDRLMPGARKVKFVVNGPLPDEYGEPLDTLEVLDKAADDKRLSNASSSANSTASSFPVSYRDFDVSHDYLLTHDSKTYQARLRRRGCNGRYTYTHTQRTFVSGQIIEVKTTISHRDYLYQLAQRDPNHFTVHKTRRCFLYKTEYFQLDIYREPAHERCQGMMFLETYTALPSDELRLRLPPFLNIGAEVTGDPAFSMFNLSLKDDWLSSRQQFCLQMKQQQQHQQQSRQSHGPHETERQSSSPASARADERKEGKDDDEKSNECLSEHSSQRSCGSTAQQSTATLVTAESPREECEASTMQEENKENMFNLDSSESDLTANCMAPVHHRQEQSGTLHHKMDPPAAICHRPGPGADGDGHSLCDSLAPIALSEAVPINTCRATHLGGAVGDSADQNLAFSVSEAQLRFETRKSRQASHSGSSSLASSASSINASVHADQDG